MRILLEQRQGGWKPWWSGLALHVHGWGNVAAPQARANGKPLDVTLDREQGAAVIHIPDMASGTVEIRR